MKAKIYIGAKKYALYIGRKIVDKTLEFLTLPARFISNKVQDLKNYLIYGNSVQDGTPSPTNPIEIESVGDRTNNLYDKTKAKKDTIISTTTGLETKSVGYYASDFIPVQVDKTYVRCLNGTKYANVVLFYDNSKNFIRSYTPGAGVPFTIPQNVSYIRFNTGSNDIDFVALIEGTQDTPYEPYGYKIPVVINGGSKNLFNKNDVIWGYHIDESGKLNASSLNSCSNFIPCKPNTTYTLTFKSNLASGTGSTIRFHSYDENKKWIAQNLAFSVTSKYGQGYKGIVEVRYTTSANAKYTRFTFKGISENDATLSKNIQLEEGSTATPYEPYVGESINIYLSEPLRRIGNYADYIDFEGQKVVRNIKEINCKNLIFDSYNANHYINTNKALDNVLKPTQGIATASLCNRFVAVDTDEMRFENLSFGIGYGSGKLFLHYDVWMSLQDGIDYINANDVIVTYPLATPIEETIDLPAISLPEGTLTIDIDTNIKPNKINITGDIDNE